MNLDIIGIGTALAAEGAAAQQGANTGTLLMLVGFVVIFYFFMIRPQSKRAKEQRDMLSKLSVEDEVVTTAGIAGKIIQVGATYIKLEVAKGVEITIQKAAISGMLPKGTLSQGTLLEIQKPSEEEKSKDSTKESEKSKKE